MRKFTWGFLAACILLLAGTGGYRLWSVWDYVQPATLEELCELSRYHSLDECEQICITLTRHPTKTKYGITYYPVEVQYQTVTPEDESFGMVMDFFRSRIFRRVLGAKLHPDIPRDEGLTIGFEFYDGAGPVPRGETHRWIKYAGLIEQLSFYKHCTDERCFSFSHRMFGSSGASPDFYEPLTDIIESVTAEKGAWLWEKEPH